MAAFAERFLLLGFASLLFYAARQCIERHDGAKGLITIAHAMPSSRLAKFFRAKKNLERICTNPSEVCTNAEECDK